MVSKSWGRSYPTMKSDFSYCGETGLRLLYSHSEAANGEVQAHQVLPALRHSGTRNDICRHHSRRADYAALRPVQRDYKPDGCSGEPLRRLVEWGLCSLQLTYSANRIWLFYKFQA